MTANLDFFQPEIPTFSTESAISCLSPGAALGRLLPVTIGRGGQEAVVRLSPQTPVLRPLPSCLSSKPRATLDTAKHRSQKGLLRWCLTVFYFRPPRKHWTPERQRTFAQRCYAPVDVYLQLGIFIRPTQDPCEESKSDYQKEIIRPWR